MSEAVVRNDLMLLAEAGKIEDEVNAWFLTTTCVDYLAYKKLPDAVEYEGRVYGRTGWDSDRGVAFYRTDTEVAKIAARRVRVA